MALPLGVLGQAAQESAVINSVTSKLTSYAEVHSVEKAYLQFDKPYYAVGDTIYFKAYITLGPQHKLSALSGILYADLIAPDNKIYRTLRLPVVSGTTHGDFDLPDSLKAGTYLVRAYTQWMRNEGDDGLFERSFNIGSSAPKQISESGKAASGTGKVTITKKPDVQFLPEGGSLINGNLSKMAFKAVGPNGLGLDIKGTITDDTETEVCTFSSSHLGMGEFVFVPRAGRVYTANIAFAGGATGSVILPKAVDNGYTMTVNDADADTIRLRITAGANTPAEKLSLVVQSGGVVYYAAERQSGGRMFTAVIPKSKFPSGIAQFTLFSQAGEPLNERLVFVNNNDRLKLNVKVSAKIHVTRQKMTVELSAKDQSGKPSTGSFSVALIDENAVPADSLGENTILTDLLLASDMKGTIEQPGYYFTDHDKKCQADLDLLMLTQGYRHFSWKKILSDKQTPLAYQVEKSIQISGNVTRHKKPAAGAKITILSNRGGFFMMDTVADNEGKFAFKDLVFGDSTKFIVQSKVPKGQNAVMLELDTILAPRPGFKFDLPAEEVAKDMPVYLAHQKQFQDEQRKNGINAHAIMLKEVVVRDKKFFTKHSKNMNGAGNADMVLTGDDLKNVFGPTLSSALMEKTAPYIDFKYGVPFKRMRPSGPMLIMVDGVEMDSRYFNDINPESIQSMEIMVSPNFATMYASYAKAGSGIIEITTKRASEYVYQRYTPGVIAYHPQGLYKAREFYSPQYDNPKTNQKISDFRSTIYWNPNVVTDKDGKATFSYFNSDNKGTYRMTIEGIDAEGNLGRRVYRYVVE